MIRFVAHLPGLLTACMLAMPVGWCCIVPGLASEAPCPIHAPAKPIKSEKPVRSCCGGHASSTEQNPAAPQTPAPKTVKCCCESSEAPVPHAFKVVVDQLFLCMLPVAETGSFHTSFELTADTFESPPPTPPLQILHCVWLC
ncbi:MAG: hypothetical protein AB7K24_29170 [Gemmataceae bacterium]